jgi:hypothetical protein
MLCDVAWARAYGTSTFILPDSGATEMSEVQEQLAESMPGLPSHVVAMVGEMTADTCGACVEFDVDSGRCNARGFMVSPKDPACDFYTRDESS